MSMIHDITQAVGHHKDRKRKGRGESSGKGKTSGRGTKGSKARVGTYIKPGYEGGQTPIFRRIPKRGFSNFDFEHRFHIVNIADLEQFADGAQVDAAALIAEGLVPDDKQGVKILGDGKLTKKLTVVAEWFSKSAYAKIIEAGGTAQNLKLEPFAFPKPKKIFVPREPVKKPKSEGAAPAAEAKASGKGEKPAAAEKAPAKAEAPAVDAPAAGPEKK